VSAASKPGSILPPLDPKEEEMANRLRELVGKRLERIEVVPLGVMFHFEGGIVYWAYGGPK
jgi:hypothetical protein